MPSPLICGLIYLLVSGLMLIPAIVPWAAVPLTPSTSSPSSSPTTPKPTLLPTNLPTKSPTNKPSISPTTSRPSFTPTTSRPSRTPSATPSTSRPTNGPTTSRPTGSPTSSRPSTSPSTSRPSSRPTSSKPSSTPSTHAPSTHIPTISRGRLLASSGGSGDLRLLWLLWLWPCIANLLMAVAYLTYDPTDVTSPRAFGVKLLGKELDGSMRWYTVLFMLPVLLPLWFFWYLRHSTWLRNEEPYNEVVPGVFLGRFPVMTLCSKWTRAQTFPEESTTIVDLTVEMPIPRSVFRKRRYLCIPTLDQCAPNVEALREIGATLSSQGNSSVSGQGNSNSNFRRLNSNEDPEGEGVLMKGAICIVCANGRGRSAVFLASLLVMRGDSDTVEQALEIIKKARPQINPKPGQIQAAKEAVDVWKAEQQSRLHSAQRGTVSRKRGLSNADVVEMPKFEPEEGELVSTDTTNIIDLSSSKESDLSKQIDESSTNRKRGFDRMDREPKSITFTLRVPEEEDAPMLAMVTEDLVFMARESKMKVEVETGGDLFGSFERVEHVVGAGPGALMSSRSFVQDETFLRNVFRILSSFQHIGEWHSHHDHGYPSQGDIESVNTSLMKTNKEEQILIIVNCIPESGQIAIGAYLFNATNPNNYRSIRIKQVPAEPVHQQLHDEIESMRNGESLAPRLMLAEDREQRGELAPQPNIRSTESRNVIDLTLQ